MSRTAKEDITRMAKDIYEMATRGDIDFLFVVVDQDIGVWTDFAGKPYEIAREIAIQGLCDHLNEGG